MIGNFQRKCLGYYRRRVARLVARKQVAIRTEQPMISFTFDDFPRSALVAGGGILSRAGLSGTYYASLGLMGTDAPTGRIFTPEDLPGLVEQGHELGCHTFSHSHAWDTEPLQFAESIRKNREALRDVAPSLNFRSFAYPVSTPRPSTKARTGAMFECCRCGGQKPNVGSVDLNQVLAFFLERSRDDFGAVKAVIEQNRVQRGWLVFATHDVAANPTPYGCTPEFFAEVVDYAVQSGARILPVASVLQVLREAETQS